MFKIRMLLSESAIYISRDEQGDNGFSGTLNSYNSCSKIKSDVRNEIYKLN